MTQEEYLNNRVNDQIKWYSAKSNWNQKRYKQLKLAEIILAVIVPALAGFVNTYSWLSGVIAFIGAAIAICAGMQSLYKYNELWMQYRITAESLKQEKFLFLNNAGPYSENSISRFKIFVERCESIISKENTTWAQYMLTKDNKNGSPDPEG